MEDLEIVIRCIDGEYDAYIEDSDGETDIMQRHRIFDGYEKALTWAHNVFESNAR